MDNSSTKLESCEDELLSCLIFIRSIKKFLKESNKAQEKFLNTISGLLTKYSPSSMTEYSSIIKSHKETTSKYIENTRRYFESAAKGHDDLKLISGSIKQQIKHLKQTKKHLQGIARITDQAVHTQSFKHYRSASQTKLDSPDKHILKNLTNTKEYSDNLSSSIEIQMKLVKEKAISEAKSIVEKQKSLQAYVNNDAKMKKIEIECTKVKKMRFSSVPLSREKASDNPLESNVEVRNSKQTTPLKPPIHPKKIVSENTNSVVKSTHRQYSLTQADFDTPKHSKTDESAVSDFQSRLSLNNNWVTTR